MTEWSVAASDDEQPQHEGYYEPTDPLVIIELYEALAKGEVPQYEGVIFPRREPDMIEHTKEIPEAVMPEENTPEKEIQEKTEFDFDTQADDAVKRFTPRRTPNRVQQKKVAKMSNVFSDIMKYKKLDDEQTKDEVKGKAEPQAS